MFSYPSSYYHAHPDNYYGGYPISPYALAQAEQARRARQLALERQEAERQRASQYLPEAFLRSKGYDTRGRHFPERASRYLPDEYDIEGDQDMDMDLDAYDYGFSRSGYQPQSYWDQLRQRQRRPSSVAQEPQVYDFDDQHQRRRQQSQTRRPSQTRQRTVSQNKRTPSPSAHHSIPISGPSSRGQPQAEACQATSRHKREQSQQPSAPAPARSSPARFQPPQSQPAPPQYSAAPEVLDEAATKIQTTYRIHRSLRTIDSLYDKFIASQTSFTFPDKLDFQVGSNHEHVVSVPTHSTPSTDEVLGALKAKGFDIPTIREYQPKLAYTHANSVLHAYTESLNRLLTSLDGVESFGEKKVRERRKAVVRSVEQEASKIERMWKSAWENWVEVLMTPTQPAVSAEERGEMLMEDVKEDLAQEPSTRLTSSTVVFASEAAVEGEEMPINVKEDSRESSSGLTSLTAVSASEAGMEEEEMSMEDMKEDSVRESSSGLTTSTILSASEGEEKPMEDVKEKPLQESSSELTSLTASSASEPVAGEREVSAEEVELKPTLQQELTQNVLPPPSEYNIVQDEDEGFVSATEGEADDVEKVKQMLKPVGGDDDTGDYVVI